MKRSDPPARTDRWAGTRSSFVGRGDELAALGELLARHRLVTVLGPPGIGKTRLVVEWLRAAPRDEASPFGAKLCDLADATSADEVVRFVAKVLSVSLAGEGERNVAHVGAALAGSPGTILVLDNFEHVLEAAHPLVTEWLEAAPEARMLVTSRERLKLEGECVFELGPLGGEAHDDAVRLFVERAREVRSAYKLAPEDEGVVRELVRELDGNPLAIELAAARTRVLSPNEILARLSQRFEVLVAERRGQPRRSALLEAIRDSWKLLPAWAAAALAASSVFRGGFDLASAEAVIDLSAYPDAPPVVDVLESLCDKSLVAVRGGAAGADMRFGLHASIRAFAARELEESGGTEAVRARHAARYAAASAAWSKALLGPDAPRALDQLRVDAENLGAAVRHLVAGPATREAADRALGIAVTLAALFGADGPFALRAAILDEAIAFADRTTPDPSLLVEALDASVLALVAIGRTAESRANAERACALAEGLEGALPGRAQSTLGLSLAMEGRVDDAARALDAARARLRDAGDRLWEGRVLGRFAWLDWVNGNLASARERFREALDLHRAVSDRTFEAMNSGYLAIVAHELGDLESPKKLLEHAIAEQQRLGHRRIEADLTSALGSLHHERGELDEARDMHARALATYRRIGHSRDEAALLADMAKVALDAGDIEEARRLFTAAVPLAKTTSNALTTGEALAGLGVVAAQEGKLDEARAAFDRARALATPGPRGTELVDLLRGHLDVAQARAAFDDGHLEAMRAHLAAARARLDAATGGAAPGALPYRERRLAAFGLARALDEAGGWGAPTRWSDGPPAGDDAALTVLRARRAVVTPEGRTIELERHPALWRIVERFVEAHVAEPGRAVSVEDLVAAGWPEERVRPAAGARRVYTALSTLRRRGLRTLLVKREDGYGLSPDARIVEG